MRETATCFTIAANGEHGRFYLTEGNEPDRRGGTTYWCVLVCHTTFGTVGHTWNSMGGPASWFLGKVDRDYAIGKLWGSNADVYDEDVARARLARLIFEDRRNHHLNAEQARAAFDTLVDEELASEAQYFALAYSEPFFSICGGEAPRATVTNGQAIGFWEKLWPVFIAELTSEVGACHA
ncbi:hypothetical protein XarbCFBP7604_09930 [Xanthomonas arboricola]|uniref:hypothetical protein n=1 Tax=Xanthomonas arboricola TaxID=56448 RepID=UPI000CEDFA01|nr:hypothetical protein [Xanthomonas arboricola]PPU34155.1 hypothetical protein XarbCFBP7604_09930 [Xanthomonas arboricola]